MKGIEKQATSFWSVDFSSERQIQESRVFFRHGKREIDPSFRIENGSGDRFDFAREGERDGLRTVRGNRD